MRLKTRCAGAESRPLWYTALTATELALVVAGGVLYTAGAVVYALHAPNPWPRTFGYHEVFHAMVVLAAAAHLIAVALIAGRIG